LKRTRVALVDMPQMLRGIVREIVAATPDLEIVAEFDDQEAALMATAPDDIDVLIMRLDEVSLASVFRERPRLRVVAVSVDGSKSCLFQLVPHAQMLGDISPQALIAAVRGELGSWQVREEAEDEQQSVGRGHLEAGG
jgi:DNA-binding NarL/FixJ family response regulator